MELRRYIIALASLASFLALPCNCGWAQAPAVDWPEHMQRQAIETGKAAWGYWGTASGAYYDWANHSNRLVPVYTFGSSLQPFKGANSCYRSAQRLEALYGHVPAGTLNPHADYFDQTDLYHWQLSALAAGKKYIIVVLFDGLDWQTTRAAASYRSRLPAYDAGRGNGLRFQDYRGCETDYGYCVTSPHNETTEYDVDKQSIAHGATMVTGGYDFAMAGDTPWATPTNEGYLIGWDQLRYHPLTDSANAATALFAGKKTFNGSVNVGVDGQQLTTVAHEFQKRGASIGVVTNVPFCHATPAAAYAHNVSRLDHQDLARDMLGLPSIAHPSQPLPGVEVVLGAGWGDEATSDDQQGANYHAGNKHLTNADRLKADAKAGGHYVIVERETGRPGRDVLRAAAATAATKRQRLLGVFGVRSGHLPYRTADGDYRPTAGVTAAENYSAADLFENPTLTDLTRSALTVLETNPRGFWLLVEAGDVDWASHDVNIDNTIGAVLSGDEAFEAVIAWVEQRDAWKETAVLVTSDHGHAFTLKDIHAFAAGPAPAK